ncbi:MAG TPA: hypothetical protein VKJ45_19745, partial [Blastocatellia bacterium]|nr:hypothetical protein [Blastocatellia bacterium]
LQTAPRNVTCLTGWGNVSDAEWTLGHEERMKLEHYMSSKRQDEMEREQREQGGKGSPGGRQGQGSKQGSQGGHEEQPDSQHGGKGSGQPSGGKQNG